MPYNYHSPRIPTPVKLAFAGMLAALVFVSAMAFLATPGRAEDAFKLPCNVGVSIGANASASKLDTGTVISLGTNAPIGGFEAGCAYFWSHTSGTWGLHGIGRVDFTDISADIMSVTALKSNTRWSALAGLSYELNKNVSLMALGGISQTRWSLQDIQASQTLGLTYGGRLTFDIGQSNVAAFLEVAQTQWRGLNLSGAQIKPSDTVARVGLSISLGK